MLSREENQMFTRVGPATPMGELLRRYWQPVEASEYVTRKPRRIKVMGEELVIYRGASGKPVLMQLRCAHRSLALDYGRVEGDSLRCAYHGWLYDRTGQCLAQPAEPDGSSFKEKIKLKSYPTQELSGLVFGYMGPEPAPLLPLFDLLRAEDGVKNVHLQQIHANFFNHVENIVDNAHLPWLHGWTLPSYSAQKVTFRWDRTEYGIENHVIPEGSNESDTTCYAFPNVNRFDGSPAEPGGSPVRNLIYRVPNDDESMSLYFVRFYRSEKRALTTNRRPTKLGEYQALEGDWWGINFNDQDRMVVEQQGVVADRPNEHLGVTDTGIIMLRQMMRDSFKAIAAGNDPFGVIRDPAKQNQDFAPRQVLSGKGRADPKEKYNTAFAGTAYT
jgi:5,5'-dehydrodivanillate O-demethylase